jgi:O-antigen/teichoic acid export membrane protein
MASASNPPRQRAGQGTAAVLLAESLALPTGFAVAAILTRSLGPESYGRYSIASTVIVTLEWILVALLTRPTIKFIAEAGDWRPVAATSFRVYLGMGLAIGSAVWLLATPVASVLQDPVLADYLRLFAIEIPIFAAASAYRSVLTGLAHFRQQAMASAGRWVGRLGLIALFTGLGWRVDGAILGNIGGVLIAAGVGQAFVGRSILGRADFARRELFQLAVPTFLLTLSVQLFGRLGLLALKALGGSGEAAGFYGAAQNLLVLAGIFNVAVGPILISTVAAGRRAGDDARAKWAATLALRFGLWMFPFTAIVSGSSSEVVALLFGNQFAEAAPLVAVLINGAAALVLISVASGLLVALGRPWPAFLLTTPLLPLALVGHVLFVPRLGALGAALVTTSTALVAASICVLVVCLIWPLRPPLGAIFKSAAVSVAAYAAAAAWSAPGPWLVVKAAVLSIGVASAAAVLGELTRKDLDWMWTDRRATSDG